MQKDLFGQLPHLEREERALLDYELALGYEYCNKAFVCYS